jgi:hypothetical protein
MITVILFFTFIVNCFSLKLNSLSINNINTDFSYRINEHWLYANVSYDIKPNKTDLMLYIGEIEKPFDRDLPNESYIYCEGSKGLIIRDELYQENYRYSCCFDPTYNNNFYIYKCPIPPHPIDINPFEDFLSLEEEVFIRNVDINHKWIKTDIIFTYKDKFTFENILKKILNFSLITIVLLVAANWLVSHINFISNKYPTAATLIHILSTLSAILLIINMINKTNDNDFITSGLMFSLITLVYSFFIIYIPSKKTPDDPDSVDQRPIFKKNTNFTYIIKCLKNKYMKNVNAVCFIILTSLQVWSIYVIAHSFREHFQASWQIIGGLIIWYSIICLLFLIAYLSAIYEVKIPIHFNSKSGQMINFIPQTRYRREIAAFNKDKNVIPIKNKNKNNTNRSYIGIYENKLFVKLDYNCIKESEIIAIDNDENNKFKFLFWKIGVLLDGKIVINQSVLKKEAHKGYFCYKKNGIIDLYNRDMSKKIHLYKVVKVDNSDKFSFVQYGSIKKGYIYTDYSFLVDSIAFIFKIIPDYTPDYQYNAIENLRTEWHRITRNLGKKYGYIYFVCFIIITLILIVYEIIIFHSIIDICVIFLMITFSIIVNTNIQNENKFKKNVKKIINYSRLLKITNQMRGDNTIKEFNFNNSIINNYIKLDVFNNEILCLDSYPNLKWIVLKKNVHFNGDRFYIKIKILNKSSIIGLGIFGNNSNNIFKTIAPGLWCSSESIDCPIGIGYHDNMFWSKPNYNNIENELSIGCGYINHKLFFTTPNNKSYCVDYNKGNLVMCISENTEYETYIYNFEYINDQILKLPIINMEKKKNNLKIFISPINKNVKCITKNNWNFDNKIVISNEDNICYFNNNIIEKILDKEKRKGIYFSIFNTNFSNNKPFECNFNISFHNKILPKFIAFGLIEEEFIKDFDLHKYIPGWRGCNSYGYHSDDGSISISNENLSEYINSNNLLWLDENNLNYSITVGFDGSSIYFINPNNIKFTRININNESWENGNLFAPVLFLKNYNISDFNLEINIKI